MKQITDYDSTKTWSGLPAPQDWQRVDFIHHYHAPHERCGCVWARLFGQRLQVWEDVAVKSDGKRWLHVSVSKPNMKIPTYEDLAEVRRLFIGDRESYMIFPTSDRYVNHANVLHMWCCLDQPDGVLPHFEEMITVEGKTQLHI